MKRISLFLCAIVALVCLSFAQDQSAQSAAAPHHPTGMNLQKMADMHQQQMEAMKADLDKMKASLDQMKANVANITDDNEKARWQNNIDLWTSMVGHMEMMMKHMGPGMGMMHHPGMKPAPPADQKPQ